MKAKYWQERYFTTFEFEDDDDGYYSVSEHKCKSCKISCVITNKGYTSEYKWSIPLDLKPSEKQTKTVNMINNILGCDFEVFTKKQAWKVINENLEKTIEQMKINEEYDYDFYGMSEYDFI